MPLAGDRLSQARKQRLPLFHEPFSFAKGIDRLHEPTIPPPRAERRTLKEAGKPANRSNAQLSFGPRTPEGKAITSLNALKTGLTGRTVLLASDNAAAFEQHLRAYCDEYKPEGLRERELVQSLAETRWRLNRIVSLEAALFAGPAADAEEGAPAPAVLDNYLKHEKTVKNLHLQEARLNRRFEKDLAELRQLQKDRMAAELLSSAEARISCNQWRTRPVGSNFQLSKISSPISSHHSKTHPQPLRNPDLGAKRR